MMAHVRNHSPRYQFLFEIFLTGDCVVVGLLSACATCDEDRSFTGAAIRI